MQTNGRALDKPRMQQLHPLSHMEFPVHSALEGKPRWDPATGSGGDPYGAEKANREVLERERLEAMAYSKKHPPKHRDETLIQREERFLRAQRAHKRAMKATATTAASPGFTGSLSTASTGMGNSVMGGTFMLGEPHNAELDAYVRTSQVPVKKNTTWSLGGF